jgi:hydrogenase maturation protein HypF
MFGTASLDMTELPPVAAFTAQERKVLGSMLARGVNAPVTTSAGRLFDAVAALLGLRQQTSYEGQAAMQLEWIADAGDGIPPPRSGGGGPPKAVEGARDEHRSRNDDELVLRRRAPSTMLRMVPLPRCAGEESGAAVGVHPRAYSFPVFDGDPMIVDWEPGIRELVADVRAGLRAATIAGAFHRGLVSAIAAVAALIGENQVVLTGGCYQNAVLAEATIAALSAAGLMPYWHRLVPPNDGGLALGQAAWAARLVERGEVECA